MQKKHFLLLILILAASLLLNIYNNDFPPEYHADELKKVHFIKNDIQDFYHPVLLLQISRVANFFCQFEDPLSVVRLGRTISALAGTAIVFIGYLLARRRMGITGSFFVAAMLALSPVLVVHAHYLKEDMLFAFFLLLSLYLLLRLLDKPSTWRKIALGAALGACYSSKYMGIVLLPIFLAAPFFLRIPSKKLFYKNFLPSSYIAIAVFLIINFPLFSHFHQFLSGLSYEINHVFVGYVGLAGRYAVGIDEYFLGFHLRFSLLPGITLIPLLLGCAYLLYHLFHWKSAADEERLFSVTLLVYYLLLEIAPLKDIVDSMRYTIPLTFFLIYFAVQGARTLYKKKRYLLGPLLLTYGLSLTLVDSSRLVYYLHHDTRKEAQKWMEQHPGLAKGDYFATQVSGTIVPLLDPHKEKERGIQYLLASSFCYDRTTFAYNLKSHSDNIDKLNSMYQTLFQLPCIEIKPAYKTFAYSNPTIKIININPYNAACPAQE